MDILTTDQQAANEHFERNCKNVVKLIDIEHTSYAFYQIDSEIIKQIKKDEELLGYSGIVLNPLESKMFRYGAIRNSKVPYQVYEHDKHS
jgi:hypothetical protein